MTLHQLAQTSYAMSLLTANYVPALLNDIKEGISSHTAHIAFCTGAMLEDMQALFLSVACVCRVLPADVGAKYCAAGHRC